MLFTSQGRRLCRSVLKLRHDLAGTVSCRFRSRRFTVGILPRGTTRLNSHRHNRRNGYAAGDDADLSQPVDCLPI
jgi:hypothetical protein